FDSQNPFHRRSTYCTAPTRETGWSRPSIQFLERLRQLRRTDLVVDPVGEGSFAAAFPPGRFPEAFPVGLRRGLREATGQVWSISRKMALHATAGFQIRVFCSGGL